MRLSAEEFAVLSRLLDVGLDLEKPAREAWLESLVEPFPGAKQVLRKMLAREASGEAEGLLDTLPKLSLAMGEAESGIETTAFQADARVGNYRLMRQIGHGGMGQVWLAEQTAPVRRFVALKLIRAGMVDESVIKRFHSERQSLAIMDHPAIAKVFDAGTTSQGQPYLVMEYVPGLPITEYCDQHRLKICDRLELFIQACEGVQHAHQKAIIHRDLKPANILVVEVDGKPVPRIIDFGLAKPAAPQLTGDALYTQLGRFLGTPGYMSPEQADPNIQDIDTRSDVYSLGVILYVLLTGLQPFETKRHRRKSVEEWLRELREDEPPRLSSRVSADRETANNRASARGANIKQLTQQLHGDLEWIALKALERDRDRRYGTPSELAADLRRYLNDEPVLARPANAGYQIRKFVRRHRIAAGFIATSTTLAILASIAALIAVSRGHEAEHQAERALQAQSRLLIEVAAQRLKASDVARAQGIILEVLMNPELAHDRSPAAISAFQEIRAADGQQAVLTGHCDVVLSAVYSPDGTRIVTASFDKTARIWDARTGVQLTVLAGHGEIVVSAGYSPDGLRIVTASADKTARIWDAQTGAQLAVLSGHGDHVDSAAYSLDGTRIVTASADKTARIWDAQTGAQLAVLSGHGDRVNSAAYSPDGTRIVTASADKTARIWDTLTGTPLAVLSGHGGRVTAAAYSPDGTRIVTASWDKTARIWDARSGKQLMVLSGHSQGLWSASYSADNTRIVTASGDETARIWDAQTGAQLAVLSGGNFLTSAAYSPDGSRIVTASRDRTARIFDARTGAQLAVLSGHGKFLESAAYSPDGTRIVTASGDETARIWDAQTGAQLAVLSGGNFLTSAAYSPDGSRIVTASLDKTARIWDARTGAQLAVLSGHGNFVESAAYSPDGTRIVTASADKTARIWDARTGASLAVLFGHGDVVDSVVYSPDGSRIVTASADKTARIWDARTGAQLAVLSGHGNFVESAAYSPDGTRIVTASDDKTARIWDARTGAQLAVLSGHGDRVNSAAYSPDGARIVTASSDKTARIWDARLGKQLAVLGGHNDAVNSAAYSPDGARIVTASLDRTARTWDAHVPADIEAQILWVSSAQTDPLPDEVKSQLGLPPDPHQRTWATRGSACDQAVAAVYDPDRVAPGVSQASINVDIAKAACAQSITQPQHGARSDYQMGRTLLAMGKLKDAKQQFELAVSKGYRAARIDLAQLLVNSSANYSDFERAVALYELAWKESVPIAAFELGHLYEYGAQGTTTAAAHVLQPDISRAWSWYQKGADAGEPNALGRFAERAETAAMTETHPQKTNADLLDAFRYYAAAAMHAHDEDWPDETWRHWRYRRATLARLLAQEGLMPQVAAAYDAVREPTMARAPTRWEKIRSMLRL